VRARRTTAYYRQLPYRREAHVVRDGEDQGEYYVARIAEIPWINIDGETREAALLRLDEIFDDCIETMIEAGDEIPEPVPWPMNTGYEPRPAYMFGEQNLQLTDMEDVPAFTQLSSPETLSVG
jgi:predicted RNase H-like HicB family nuclease